VFCRARLRDRCQFTSWVEGPLDAPVASPYTATPPKTAQECDMKLPITIALAAFSLSVATATIASASQHDYSKSKCGDDEKKDEKKDEKS